MGRLTKELQDMASEARGKFARSTRNDGREYWHTNGAEWIRDLCMAAHEDAAMLPDDHRYEFIVAALDAIGDAELGTPTEELAEMIEADIYTSDLLNWLASRNDRIAICDEASEELGLDASPSLEERIRLGQWWERRGVLGAVLTFLEERLDELEAQDDDGVELSP